MIFRLGTWKRIERPERRGSRPLCCAERRGSGTVRVAESASLVAVWCGKRDSFSASAVVAVVRSRESSRGKAQPCPT